MDTIFALASGSPPSAIAVVRISGRAAGATLSALAGKLPVPRRATLAQLRNSRGEELDRALVLWFPGPASATGEDLAELHLHGGRAMIAAVEAELGAKDGLRRARPGEFTRRAFVNGRIDLAEAEGLADLLSAETEIQRRAALANAGGILSRQVERWRDQVLVLSAEVEAVLDFADEDDLGALPDSFGPRVEAVLAEIAATLEAPAAELLREGYRVALAGPPNAGKSTLFNALVADEAAITAAIPGTTRDVLTRPVALGGVPFLFVDMAGLREQGADAIEMLGIARAEAEIDRADLVLWLGEEGHGPDRAWEIEAQSDRRDHSKKVCPKYSVSALTGGGMDALKLGLIEHARSAMPRPGQGTLSQRQRAILHEAYSSLCEAASERDPLCQAEALRVARLSFDRLVGRSSTEDMLDALFGRFCIGK